jgi:hypothetical protein
MTAAARGLLAPALLLVALPAAAQTSFPMITHALPVAVQRGTTADVTVSGQMDFAGAYKVLVGGTGVTATVVPEPAAKPPVRAVRLRVTAAADAPPGVREFRIATALGVSSLGQLLVVDDPVVLEAAAGGMPQPIPVPCVVCGRTETAENVDSYRFTATAGRVLTFEVFAARLQDKIHDLQKHADPLVSVCDAAGRELAADDDGAFADPVLAFRVPRDGEYVVKVRDAKYDGDPRWAYALAVTDRPYAVQPFPLGVPAGKPFAARPVLAGGGAAEWPLVAPAEPGVHTLTHTPPGGRASNPVPVVATRVPVIEEREPNDAPAEATPLPVPGGANGRVGRPRDLDHYRFKGAKGQPVTLTVYARRFGTPLRSRLDSVLDVVTPAGRVLATNDDAVGKDAALTFAPPADGEYVVRVRDLNNKGGDAWGYYLEADLARPDFALKADPSKAMVGPGSRMAWFVQVTRLNGFAGPVKVAVEGLPPGLSASPLTVPPAMTQGVVVLSAAADAKPDAAAVRVVGTADVAGTPTTRVATPVEEIYLPGGGRGRFDAGMPAAAVTGPSDVLDVAVTPAKVVLKPGQEVRLDVTVRRRADYDKPLTLDVPLRHLGQVFATPLPPGVTMVDGKSKTLLGTGSPGRVVLRAAADAPPCADVPVCVQAFVPINFVVKLGYSSPPILLSVTK